VFIWDDSRRSEIYPELQQGLKKIDNVVGVVLVPRPGKMDTESV
jgi:hypothetical protein